uniref:Uncharacterized protein n=1 Tax=Steinernema glaseri TaxID=37863 RepID=A0A1I8A7M3_9BILA
MRLLLLLSVCSICLCKIYVQNLPRGTVAYGLMGEVTMDQNEPSDCLLHWQATNNIPKAFIYNSREKTCTALTSVLGTKSGKDDEESYIIELSKEICHKNVSKAVEDIIVTNNIPKAFIYNSQEKTCTPLMSVLGTKSGNGDEESYIIELDEEICQKNVTKAVEDIIEIALSSKGSVPNPTMTSTPEPTLDGDCTKVADLIAIPDGGNANDTILISSYYDGALAWENKMIRANFDVLIYQVATKIILNSEIPPAEKIPKVIAVLEQFMGVNEVRKELVMNIVIKGWGTNEQLFACKQS